MSIESFCNQYPANPDVRAIVGSEMITGRSDKSLVVILAVELAKEGRNGVRKLIDKLNPSDTAFEIVSSDFQSLPAEDRENMFTSFAAFVFGNSVLSLERTLVNGEYDHEDFCNRYNLEASSFLLTRVEGTEKIEKLSYDKLAIMHSLVKEDKTFAIFFEEKGIQAMPNILRQFLETAGIIPIIQKDILPIYEPRAKFLVD